MLLIFCAACRSCMQYRRNRHRRLSVAACSIHPCALESRLAKSLPVALFVLKNATTATSHPVFETSKSPLRKSPNLQIANPLYLCRFPDDSGRQATTDYSGLNPTLSAISRFLMKLVDSERRLSISTVTRRPWHLALKQHASDIVGRELPFVTLCQSC